MTGRLLASQPLSVRAPWPRWLSPLGWLLCAAVLAVCGVLLVMVLA